MSLVLLQPDDEKSPAKPGYKMDCEERKAFSIPAGNAAAGEYIAFQKVCCVTDNDEVCNVAAGALAAGISLIVAAAATLSMLFQQ